jgi:hypothetical protein
VRYPAVDINTAPVTPDDRVYYYTEAPAVFFGQAPAQMAATLLVPAATVALVYALFTVSTVRDDLGAYPPVDGPRLPAPLAVPEGTAVTTPEPAQSTAEWQRPHDPADASAVEPGQR